MSLDTRIETKRIALVGPSFGLASVKIGSALRSSPDVVLVGDCWYAENSYERAAGKFVSRVLRTTAEILPMPKMLRERIESWCAGIRFNRRVAAERIVREATASGKVDVVALVKPMFLEPADVERIRATTGATTMVLYLWDALFRTPNIRKLLPLFDAVYTTEPSDCSETIRLLPLPTEFPPSAGRAELQRSAVGAFFFCGTLSLARLRAARALSRAACRNNMNVRIHLVTDSRIGSLLVRAFGFSSEPLGRFEYQRALRACEVVVDLGRAGQTSPSERFADAVVWNKRFLTTNETFAESTGPITWVPRFRRRALNEAMSCLRSEGGVNWKGNADVARFCVTPIEWVSTIVGKGTW